jgi:hypothetical protein
MSDSDYLHMKWRSTTKSSINDISLASIQTDQPESPTAFVNIKGSLLKKIVKLLRFYDMILIGHEEPQLKNHQIGKSVVGRKKSSK